MKTYIKVIGGEAVFSEDLKILTWQLVLLRTKCTPETGRLLIRTMVVLCELDGKSGKIEKHFNVPVHYR
jgi:hypothetical protein